MSQQPTQWARTPGQWPAPPGQFGPSGAPPPSASPPPAPTLPKKSGSKNKPFLIAGALIAVIIVGAVVIVVMSKVVNRDVNKVAVAGVQTEIQQILVDRTTGYGADDIKDIKCNNGQDPTAKKGESFSCDVSVRGKPHQLKVTFDDDSGTYEVGLPQLVGGK